MNGPLRNSQSSGVSDSLRLCEELRQLQQRLETRGSDPDLAAELARLHARLDTLLSELHGNQAIAIDDSEYSPAPQLQQLREEIETQRALLDDVKSLRCQIGVEADTDDDASDEAQNEALAVETLEQSEQTEASEAAHEVSAAPVEENASIAELESEVESQPSLDLETQVPEADLEQTEDESARETAAVGAEYAETETVAATSDGRRSLPGLPSVRSIRTTESARRDPSHPRHAPRRPVSARRLNDSRALKKADTRSTRPLSPMNPARRAEASDPRQTPRIDEPRQTPDTDEQPQSIPQAIKSPGPTKRPQSLPVATSAVAQTATPAVSPKPTRPFRPVQSPAPDFESVEVVLTPSRASAEIRIRARWWNVGLLVLTLAPLSVVYGWVTIANIATAWSMTELEDVIHERGEERKAVGAALARGFPSPLVRFDGRRDYLVAQAMQKIEGEGAEPVRQNVLRAIERSPANVWNRLTLARLEEDSNFGLDADVSFWDPARRLASAEPAYWNQLARHWCDANESEKAIAAYRKLLIHRPEATGEALRNLFASTVALDEALRCVPASAIASLQAATFLQDQRIHDWRDRSELLLKKIAKDSTKRSSDDFAAEAGLCMMLDRPDDAVAALLEALQRRPDRQDWKLRLARLHYSDEKFVDSDRLALEVIRTEPGTELADQARLLREKIELVTGGGPVSAN